MQAGTETCGCGRGLTSDLRPEPELVARGLSGRDFLGLTEGVEMTVVVAPCSDRSCEVVSELPEDFVLSFNWFDDKRPWPVWHAALAELAVSAHGIGIGGALNTLADRATEAASEILAQDDSLYRDRALPWPFESLPSKDSARCARRWRNRRQ